MPLKDIQKKLLWLILLVLTLPVFTGCEEDFQSTEITINYGTSFGECMGYCQQQLSFKNNSTEYIQTSWDPNLATIKRTINPSEDAVKSLFDAIDMNAFIELPNVIGCPDCADGGAEWLEIIKDNVHHKVTFEYLNEPDTLKTYIGTLRMILSDAQEN